MELTFTRIFGYRVPPTRVYPHARRRRRTRAQGENLYAWPFTTLQVALL